MEQSGVAYTIPETQVHEVISGEIDRLFSIGQEPHRTGSCTYATKDEIQSLILNGTKEEWESFLNRGVRSGSKGLDMLLVLLRQKIEDKKNPEVFDTDYETLYYYIVDRLYPESQFRAPIEIVDSHGEIIKVTTPENLILTVKRGVLELLIPGIYGKEHGKLVGINIDGEQYFPKSPEILKLGGKKIQFKL